MADDIQLHLGQGGKMLAAHEMSNNVMMQRGLLVGMSGATGMYVDVSPTYPLPVETFSTRGNPIQFQLSLDGAGAVYAANGDYSVTPAVFRTGLLAAGAKADITGLRVEIFNDVDPALFTLIDYWGTFLPSTGWDIWQLNTPIGTPPFSLPDYKINAQPVLYNPDLLLVSLSIRQMTLAAGMGGTGYSYGVIDMVFSGSVKVDDTRSLAIQLNDDYTELDVHGFYAFGEFFTSAELAGDASA